MSATMTLGGNATGAVAAVQSYNKALDETEKKSEKVTGASRQLVNQAQRIKEAVDPAERYRRKLEEIDKALQHELITAEQARQAQARLAQQFQDTGNAGDA